LRSAKIIQALNEIAKRGVQVRIVYDATASSGSDKKLISPIQVIPRSLNGLMHLKLLIIDRHHTWLGSANMNRDSLKSHANLMTHLDHEEFAKGVLLKTSQIIDGHFEKPLPVQIFTIADQEIELRFLPDDPTAIARIKELIREAKTSIRVAMYTFTREDLADTLIRAHNRGINVQVVLDLGQANGSSKKIAELLKKNGVFVSLKDTGGMMHHKFLLIDDSILEHGSANWTKAAFKQNDDHIKPQCCSKKGPQ
jgi:phosphatidylserine/phosphatidylglycerophosphate/cardiolipin synthase-like enzyme